MPHPRVLQHVQQVHQDVLQAGAHAVHGARPREEDCGTSLTPRPWRCRPAQRQCCLLPSSRASPRVPAHPLHTPPRVPAHSTAADTAHRVNLQRGTKGTICGCPLAGVTLSDGRTAPETAVCRRDKSTCLAHTGWEFLLLGELAQEIVSLHLLLGYYAKREQRAAERELRRGNIVGLAVHSTEYHPDGQETHAPALPAAPAGSKGPAEWLQRRMEVDPPNQKEMMERPTVTVGTKNLPRHHWR